MTDGYILSQVSRFMCKHESAEENVHNLFEDMHLCIFKCFTVFLVQNRGTEYGTYCYVVQF